MANSPKNVAVMIPIELRDRLKVHRRPHQAIAGVIEELLDLSDKIEGKPTPTKNEVHNSTCV